MHKKITKVLTKNAYSAHPHHNWERDLNENTNGLMRQHFPKKTSFENLKKQDIKFVEQRVNYRPHKTLEMNYPAASPPGRASSRVSKPKALNTPRGRGMKPLPASGGIQDTSSMFLRFFCRT